MYVFLDGHKFDYSADLANHFVVAGDEVWVACRTRKVNVARYMGHFAYGTSTVDLTSYFTNPCVYVVKGINHIYAFEGTAQSEPYSEYFLTSFVAIDRTTKEVVYQKQLPTNAHCIPCFANFKLWFTTPAAQTISALDRQRLFFYDTTSDQWSSSVTIPGNKQFRPRQIVWSYSNYMIVDAFNDNGYLKFDYTDGSYIDTITTNRKPLSIFVSGDRKIYVSGKNGRVNVMDVDTDLNVANYSTYEEALSLYSVGDYIWSVTPKMVRTDMTTLTDNLRVMDGQDKDFSIEAFSTTTFKQIYISEPYVHNVWNFNNETISSGTEPRRTIVLGTNGKLFVAYNFQDSWDLREIREYELSVKCTAIVATGPESYYGETE